VPSRHTVGVKRVEVPLCLNERGVLHPFTPPPLPERLDSSVGLWAAVCNEKMLLNLVLVVLAENKSHVPCSSHCSPCVLWSLDPLMPYYPCQVDWSCDLRSTWLISGGSPSNKSIGGQLVKKVLARINGNPGVLPMQCARLHRLQIVIEAAAGRFCFPETFEPGNFPADLMSVVARDERSVRIDRPFTVCTPASAVRS
jgi:hypothetical protein